MSRRRIALIFDNTLRPETTGTYCLRAIRKHVDVEFFSPDQIEKIPRSGFDLYLNIDDGLGYRLPGDLRPSAWWVIDTHMDLPWAIEKGQDFDWLFAAQRDGSEQLTAAGRPAVWLPLACDPEIHRPWPVENRWDICFVGNVHSGARHDLIQSISHHFPRSFVGKCYFDEYAKACSESKIGFNRSVKNDVNMRVFETLSCGPLLITNDLSDNGQSELFESDRHLVTYRDGEELLDKVRFYLRSDALRKRIAQAGHAEVVEKHTYVHRMGQLLKAVKRDLNRVSVSVNGNMNDLRSAAQSECEPGSTVGSQKSQNPAQGRPKKDASYFECARPEVVALIPMTARRVLDIGCGAGRLGELLKQRQSVEVIGIEMQPSAVCLARDRLDDVLELNVEDATVEFPEQRFDCIVCADVLEHFREPAPVLSKIRRWLTADGHLVVSLPNVRHYTVVAGLLDGNWTYESAGLLDNDHVRFFTRREIEKLFYRQGFEIVSLIPKPGPGHAEWVASGRPGAVNAGSLHIEGLAPENAEEFFTYQYLVVAQPLADKRENRVPGTDEGLSQLRAAFPWPLHKPDVPIPTANLGWCCDGVREVLRQELTRPTRIIVELGAWLGLSTRLIADLAPDAHVITIDHWEGSPEHHQRSDWAALLPTLFQTFQSLTWDYRDRVTPLRMTTLQGLQAVADAGIQPDLIYIDADHSYESVSADLAQCQKLFPHARLVGDDYDCIDVHRALHEFAERCGRSVESIGPGWLSWRLSPLPLKTKLAPAGYELTSIIIVTFNERGYTKECVDSIRLRTDEPYELIFVDNGSTDGTPEYLATLADVRIIRNGENRGFPAAVNQGLKLARGEQVLLLNNDTVVSTGWLRKMLDALHRDPKIGLVGPCSNNVSGSQMIDATYADMSLMDGFAWEWGKKHTGLQEETDRLVGFCLLIDKAVIDKVGGLDERFGIGCFEDDDICLRALRAGWTAVIARDSFVHHYGSRTFASSGIDCASLISENRRKFVEKWEERPLAADAAVPKSGFGMTEAPGGGLLLTVKRPRLSLCMIVRNNETTIRPCLESIRPWVDEMIVVDTGSTDSTPQICEELGATVYFWDWRDDFSAARNQSLDHATGEWLFWMDSDDTIPEDCGCKLRELAYGEHASDILGYIFQVHCPAPDSDGLPDVTAVDHVKLFPNRPDLRFEHRIHEQILPAIRRAGGNVAFTELYVVHSGSDHSVEGRAGKLERDFKLLHLDLKERPNHPFVLFNLGMTCADVQQYDEAIEWLNRCLKASTPVESHVRKAYALLVSSLYQQSRFDEAFEAGRRGRELYPDDKELQFRQAMLNHQLGHLEEAARDYRAVLGVPAERHFTSIDVGLTGYKARHNLALVYEDQGRSDLAEAEWQTILRERPSYHPAEVGLTECLLKQRHHERAATMIQKLLTTPSYTADGHRLAARMIEASGDLGLALRRIEQGIDEAGEDPGLLREQARLLYLTRDLAAAATVLKKLAGLLPHDQSVQNNLQVVMADLRGSGG